MVIVQCAGRFNEVSPGDSGSVSDTRVELAPRHLKFATSLVGVNITTFNLSDE